MPAKALSVDHGESSPWGGCFLRCFFGIFFLVGAGTFYFMALRPLWGIYSAQSWVETPCTILSSELGVHDGDDGDTYSIDMTYEYAFDGREYKCDRYHFMGLNSNTAVDWKREVVKEHPPGRQTVCYVDPDKPDEAVINRSLIPEMWWGLFPLPFLAVGLGGLLFGSRLMNGKKADPTESTARSLAADGTQRHVDEDGTHSDDDGPVTLEAESSPLGAFGCALFAALFWNGITSVFVYQAYLSHKRGDPEWFLTIFIIPFVLVGLGIVVGVLYTFLAIFNPRPALTLDRRRLPLGSTAKVSWTFTGNASKLQNLKITLKGEEKATYRRGTDTHTDTETFCEQVVFDSPQSYEFASGEAEFTVPTDSMHSFSADNNEIVWSLHVAGDVPLWPDVDATFPVSVTPHEPTPY